MTAAALPDDLRPQVAPMPAPADAQTERAPAWELVETGRYRPLRTRGSFPGRELG